MRSQRVWDDWATELNWRYKYITKYKILKLKLNTGEALSSNFVENVSACMLEVRSYTEVPFISQIQKLYVSVDLLKHFNFNAVRFSSVAQSYPTLCDPMNHSTPGFAVHHQLPEFTQTHVHQVGDAIQPSHPLSSPFPPASKSLPASDSFPMSQLFTWGGQSTGVSALASFLSKKSQGWSPSDTRQP